MLPASSSSSSNQIQGFNLNQRPTEFGIHTLVQQQPKINNLTNESQKKLPQKPRSKDDSTKVDSIYSNNNIFKLPQATPQKTKGNNSRMILFNNIFREALEENFQPKAAWNMDLISM